jgi:phage antirepressor YoqD-like protein
MPDSPTTITPKALADELGIDAKRLRGWLRANHTRDAAVKNTTWAIDAEAADAARARFTPPADDETADA